VRDVSGLNRKAYIIPVAFPLRILNPFDPREQQRRRSLPFPSVTEDLCSGLITVAVGVGTPPTRPLFHMPLRETVISDENLQLAKSNHPLKLWQKRNAKEHPRVKHCPLACNSIIELVLVLANWNGHGQAWLPLRWRLLEDVKGWYY
jgi:hypothetical protein